MLDLFISQLLVVSSPCLEVFLKSVEKFIVDSQGITAVPAGKHEKCKCKKNKYTYTHKYIYTNIDCNAAGETVNVAETLRLV